MADTPILTGEAFARSYDARSDEDMWELVEDYWRVMDDAARHTSLGSQALASRLDLPRSRIRPWVREDEPVRPDAVRDLQVAEERGWIPLSDGSETFGLLNHLVAWIFSGGSIRTDHYVPTFAVADEADRHRLVGLFDDLAIDYRIAHERDAGRATEYRPVMHASVLGQVLSLLGAPVGTKDTAARIELPAYLDDAPRSIRREFVGVYLQNSGQRHTGKETLTLREERSEGY